MWGAWKARAGYHGTTPLALVTVVLVLSMDANWSASKQGWVLLAYAAASGQLSTSNARRAVARVHPSQKLSY